MGLGLLDSNAINEKSEKKKLFPDPESISQGNCYSLCAYTLLHTSAVVEVELCTRIPNPLMFSMSI